MQDRTVRLEWQPSLECHLEPELQRFEQRVDCRHFSEWRLKRVEKILHLRERPEVGHRHERVGFFFAACVWKQHQSHGTWRTVKLAVCMRQCLYPENARKILQDQMFEIPRGNRPPAMPQPFAAPGVKCAR